MSKRVSLTAELAAFIAERVESGRYGSASEVVRMALRLLEDKEAAPPFQRGKEAQGVRDAR